MKFKKDHLYLLLSILIVGIYSITFKYVCIFKNVFGIPCPGCGFTRAYLCLLKGDVRGAFHFHPLFLLPPMILIIYFVKSEVIKNKIFIGIVAFIVVLTYIIRMKYYFPNVEPMTYNKNSLLYSLLKLFIFKKEV